MSRVVICVLLLAVAGLAILTASSLASNQCNARVIGGVGTIEDPLVIEVSGDVGLSGLIDSLLPYNGIPSIVLRYRDLSFSIPGINEFIYYPRLGFAFLVVAIIGAFLAASWLALTLTGRSIKIVKREE